jgi:hypothetical protein
MKRRPEDLVVFLGPSLPAGEARRLVNCHVLPPARQGDVWRVLALRPRAIVLVDGLGGGHPAVWHQELLSALEAGVSLYGGAGLGALRAAELAAQGMVGVGQIFEWYRDGVLVDDSEVAQEYAGAEQGYRPLTVSLVNVRHVAAQARAARVLHLRQARALVTAAASLHYSDRTWRRIVESVRSSWPAATWGGWEGWFSRGVEDLQRADAITCLRAAAAFLSSAAPTQSPKGRTRPMPSSLERRRRLEDDVCILEGRAVPASAVLAQLQRAPDSEELAAAGLRRALLAGWARSLGLEPTVEELRAAEAEWWRQHRVRPAERESFLSACGLDGPGLRRLCEETALERLVLAQASRLLPEGPTREEALAAEARLRGRWAFAARGTRWAQRRRAQPPPKA